MKSQTEPITQEQTSRISNETPSTGHIQETNTHPSALSDRYEFERKLAVTTNPAVMLDDSMALKNVEDMRQQQQRETRYK